MEADVSSTADSPANSDAPALQLKGSLLTLTTLEIHSTDQALIEEQLKARIAQAPDFFANAPVLLTLEYLPEEQQPDSLSAVLELCRSQGLSVLALRSELEANQAAAAACNLPMLSPSLTRDRALPGEIRTEIKLQRLPPRIVTTPVRSGQQIVAKDSDLIVTASVSAGAELLADGNIHVYGAMRGRALAGINGDTEARVFCQQLGAELVSIAGQYKIAEDLRRLPVWDSSVQISLEDGQMHILPLG